MTDPISRIQLENAAADAATLERVTNASADEVIVSRQGQQLRSLAKVQQLGEEAAAEAIAAAVSTQALGYPIWALPFGSIGASNPGSPTEGQRWINTTDHKGYIYTSGAAVGFTPQHGQGAVISNGLIYVFGQNSGWNARHGLASLAATYADIATLDAACATAGVPWHLDYSFTLTGNTVYAASVIGAGGVITMPSTYTLTMANFECPPTTQAFNCTGTGIVTLNRCGDAVYNGWFGMKGSSGAAETTAFQAAINCAQVSGGLLKINSPALATNYRTGTVTITSALRMVGPAFPQCYIEGYGLSAGQYVINVDGTVAPNLDYVQFENLTIYSNNGSPSGIKLNNAATILFRNVGLRNLVDGIFITGTRGYNIEYDRVTGVLDITGSMVKYSAYTGGGQHSFQNCTFIGAAGFSLDSDSTLDAIHHDSSNFEGCTSLGESLLGSFGGIVHTNLRCENCAGATVFNITPALGNTAGCYSVFGGRLNGTGGGSDQAFNFGGSGSVQGINIMGVQLVNFPTRFINLSGTGTGGQISGNQLGTCSDIVNALRPGIMVFNNSNDSGPLGPQLNPPLVTPTLPANATDLATAEALANACKAALIAAGLAL